MGRYPRRNATVLLSARSAQLDCFFRICAKKSGSILCCMTHCDGKSYVAIGGGANHAERCRTWRFINDFGVNPAKIPQRILLFCAPLATPLFTAFPDTTACLTGMIKFTALTVHQKLRRTSASRQERLIDRNVPQIPSIRDSSLVSPVTTVVDCPEFRCAQDN